MLLFQFTVELLSFYKIVNWKEKFNLTIFSKMISQVPKCWILDLCETYWLDNKDCLLDNISRTLNRIPFNGFNNIKVCVRILCTSLMTTGTCLWPFSAMRRLKNYARSTMVLEILNGIALMQVRQEIVLEIEKVIDLFSTKNRRLTFT